MVRLVLIAFEKVWHIESINATDAHFFAYIRYGAIFGLVCRFALQSMLVKMTTIRWCHKGASIKYVRTEGEGGGLKIRKICVR